MRLCDVEASYREQPSLRVVLTSARMNACHSLAESQSTVIYAPRSIPSWSAHLATIVQCPCSRRRILSVRASGSASHAFPSFHDIDHLGE